MSKLIEVEDANGECMQIEGESSDIVNPNEIVIKEKKITVVFTYPLTGTFSYIFKSRNGFTRRQLFECVQKKYREIYQEENAASKSSKMPEGILNRGFSKGPYGIWGHDIGDLFLEEIRYQSNGKCLLSIGS